MPLEAGASYSAGVMVSGRADSAAELIVSWYDANKQYIGLSRGNLVKDGGWGYSSLTATPPAGAAFARVGGSARCEHFRPAEHAELFTCDADSRLIVCH